MILTIDSVDRSALCDWQSILIEQSISDADFLSFSISLVHTGQTYQPEKGMEVTLTDGATVLFGGYITETTISTNTGVSASIMVRCRDYTEECERRQVVEVYTAQTISDIFLDIAGRYLPGITTTQVQTLSDVIPKIRFNYVSVTQAFRELCDLCDCEWTVDYSKDLVLRKRGTLTAPFTLAEDAESFIQNSFSYTDNISQLRNAIYVRGGTETYTTDSSTAEKYVCDGQQRVFPLGQKYINDAVFSVAKSTNGGSSYSPLTVGIYGVDAETAYNVLYDANNRSLIFPDASKPAATNIIRVYGNYNLPVIIYKVDTVSENKYGLYEWRIIDKSIGSKNEARARAQSELAKYSESLVSGAFSTYKDGLTPGMMITAALPSIAIAGSYYIQSVTSRFIWQVGTVKRVYTCRIIGTELANSLDYLLRLLVLDKSKEIEINDDEILDVIYGFSEKAKYTEAWTVTAHPSATPTFEEAAEYAEAYATNPWGATTGPTWVAGPYFPTSGSDQLRMPQIDAGNVVQ